MCIYMYTVEVKISVIFVPPLSSNRMVEQLNSNGKTAFVHFKTIRSVIALDQPFVHLIISLHIGQCSSPLHRSRSLTSHFSLFAHVHTKKQKMEFW